MPIRNQTAMKDDSEPNRRRAAEEVRRRRTEKALEQGLEESMAGSDPVSITQPDRSAADKREAEKQDRSK